MYHTIMIYIRIRSGVFLGTIIANYRTTTRRPSSKTPLQCACVGTQTNASEAASGVAVQKQISRQLRVSSHRAQQCTHTYHQTK